MKIGYLVPEFPGQTHGFFWRETGHLEKSGIAVALISTKRPRTVVEHGFSAEARARTHYMTDFLVADCVAWAAAMVRAIFLLRASGLEVSMKSRARLSLLAAAGIMLARLAKRRGLQHIQGHSCGDVGYILAFSKLAGGPPYSLTLHGDLAIYGSGQAFKFAHAKFVTCVTHALCDQVRQQLPGLQTPVVMIRMGIEPSTPDLPPVTWSPAGALHMVTVARLNRMKGHQFAIAAMDRLVREGYDMRYTIAGEGECTDEIAALVKAAGLHDRVSLVGAVPNNEIDALLRSHDVCVLSSVGLGEAAPVAVMEAMRAGIPVVSSIIGGTPELIEDNGNGFLFPQRDVAELTGRLRNLADDVALRERIGNAGKRHANATFLTSDAVSRLVECIKA
ncbi:glycosyltransferase family 4 protein [Novosphingobium sp.]|uniref:glycosyltransferase family 4 protein n=1 Tax=Novosphingobium sp. TaxID=1874826 RepID=UPI003B5183C4